MPIQPSVPESAHDQGVSQEAEELERAGWSVTATVERWDDPEPVGASVPDIVATKRGTLRVVEVEPEGGQYDHDSIRQAVGRRRNAVFYTVVVDANGRRIRYTDTK